MSILKNGKVSRATRLGVVVTLAAATVVGVSTPASGPYAATVVSVAGTGFKNAAGTTLVTSVYVDSATCGATPTANSTAVAGTQLNVSTTTRFGFKTPAVADPSTTPKTYNVCAYASGALVAAGTYKVYTVPTIHATTPITPASGGVGGGNTVTVMSAGATFTSKTTATLAGAAMTGIKIAKDGTYFTAIVPAYTTAAVTTTQTADLIVTTEGGASATSVGVYTYRNSLTVSPTTVPTSSVNVLTIKGYGFSTLTFTNTNNLGDSSSGPGTWDVTSTTTGDAVADQVYTNSATAHVYLVNGNYDGTLYVAGTTNKTLGQTSECLSPIVVSDTEILCTLNTYHTFTAAAGAYTFNNTAVTADNYNVVIVGSGGAAPGYKTQMTSGSAITVSPF
jgi:hypothetical protein